MGEYLLPVIAAAILVSVLMSCMPEKGSATGLLRMAGGIFLLIVLIQPVTGLNLRSLTSFIQNLAPDTTYVSVQGQELARAEMAARIKEETEAYILDKARLYDPLAEAEVGLSDDQIPVPVSVTIYSAVPDGTRDVLAGELAKELNIPKECQTWIGNP